MHLVLLGDSIFDNGRYTRGEPDVVSHLKRLLPSGWRASLLAVDGATTSGVAAQLARLPPDATCLALSVGGNDALRHLDLLSTPVASTGEALDLFGTRVAGFAADYERALGRVAARGLPVVACTIYNGALPDPAEAARARVALTLFNDAILRAALKLRCAALELRLVCDRLEDYANPIEPSGRGGAKIARALARATGALDEREPALYQPHRAGD